MKQSRTQPRKLCLLINLNLIREMAKAGDNPINDYKSTTDNRHNPGVEWWQT